MPLNKFVFQVVGLIPLTVIEMSGIEDELETTELPDRTVASGGNTKAFEFTLMMPTHHTAEQAVMELWLQESKDPVSPTYKKPSTLTMERLSGTAGRNFSISGVFPKKRKLPDMDKANEGEMAMTEWTMSGDDVLPL